MGTFFSNNNKKWVIAGFSLLIHPSFADDLGGFSFMPDCWTWVSSISAGSAWASSTDTNTLFLTPTLEKTYTPNGAPNTLVEGEFFVGVQNIFPTQFRGQVGVAIAGTSDTNISGVITNPLTPELVEQTYQYKMWHSNISAKTKILVDCGYWIVPWFSGGIGVGFNRTHTFISTPATALATTSYNFTDNTTTAFTYTFGVGLQHGFTPHWQIGVGYEFANWGKSELGRAPTQITYDHLTLDHYHTQGVLLNLTYVV